MKKIIGIVLALILLVGCQSAGIEKADEAAVNSGQLEDRVYVMGLDDTFAPMGFRDESGELVGFDIDLAKDAAEKMGITLEFQPIDWSMKETELDAGNIDFIWNGYSITAEREDKVSFSQPYLENRQIIVTKSDSKIKSKLDLKDKVVTVQAESSALDAVNKEEGFVSQLKQAPVEYATNVESFKDVENGRADAIVVDEVLARYYMKQNGEENYKVLEENFGEEKFAVGMRKDDSILVDTLNKALEEQKEDGTYDEIYAKWFSEK